VKSLHIHEIIACTEAFRLQSCMGEMLITVKAGNIYPSDGNGPKQRKKERREEKEIVMANRQLSLSGNVYGIHS